MRKNSVLIVGMVAILLSSCLSTPVKEDTVSPAVAGTWALERFDSDKANVIGSKFDSGSLTLDLESKKATFSFQLARATIDSKLADWKKDYPDLTVDSYTIISTATWKVDRAGETIFFDPLESNLDIKGSGANFEGFYGWEMSKFSLAKSTQSSGGILGGLLSAAVTSATKTEDYFIKPDFAVGYWVQKLSPEGFTLNNKVGGYMELKK